MLYQSSRKEIPANDVLAVEVELAMEDLAEIPSGDLHVAFRAAKVDAGAFLPSNGLVVKLYRGKAEDAHEAARRAIRDRNTNFYLNYRPPDPSKEEIEATAAMLQRTRESLESNERIG